MRYFTSTARSRVETPLKSWLFQASLRNCKNCVHNWEDHNSFDFTSAVQYMIYFIYNFIIHVVIFSFLRDFGIIKSCKGEYVDESNVLLLFITKKYIYCLTAALCCQIVLYLNKLNFSLILIFISGVYYLVSIPCCSWRKERNKWPMSYVASSGLIFAFHERRKGPELNF